MTPGGAVVARMASAQRAGEERHAALALATAGFPILATVAGTATFEGADALWFDPGTVVVGTGFRTSGGGVSAVRAVLRDQGVDVVEVPLGPGVQHLLGAVTLLDERLAAIHATGATPQLRELLSRRGYRLVEFPVDRELTEGRGMNFVTLGPRRVLMPAGCPAARRRLESAGVDVECVEIGEYLKAAGGLGCLTAILTRDLMRVEGLRS
jgi:N-dimethylarginine dimethylaminohydrolase